ncbi:DUF1146 domain-containing protein [Culicoidibacter larvae]|uniref:DUF1146 domain-containing protein n=1 Tax=Culicoidibacter larvae TaxID=2579976 RepID=A0A5R8QC71_9FIRM|nr:DUF1146 domain-containing protein [Culicoidibacter larvae]TLG73944.1 DUF1146 domain-containing protein [Culicoidibacter larvae]
MTNNLAWYITQFGLYLVAICASFYLFQFIDFKKFMRPGTEPRVIIFIHIFVSIACGFLVGNFLIAIFQIGQQMAGLV